MKGTGEVGIQRKHDVRQALAEHLESQAHWRDEKAREYPDDPRNEQAASAMRALATYILQLPLEDPRLQYLALISMDEDVWMASEDALPFDIDDREAEWLEFGEEESRFWGRVGFDDGGKRDPSDHLDEIVAFYRGYFRDAVSGLSCGS